MLTKSPNITVVDERWQRQKCAMHGLTFHSVCRQPDHLLNEQLSKYQPWETEDIVGDGNCLFRCLSKIITGSQENHSTLRSIISNYMASEGTTQMGWYFRQSRLTPCDYFLNERPTYLDGVWGGDFEIMAASAILQADIFIANNNYSMEANKYTSKVRWSLLRATKDTNSSLYIKNYHEHYEPVVSMINSSTPTFGMD